MQIEIGFGRGFDLRKTVFAGVGEFFVQELFGLIYLKPIRGVGLA